MKTIFEENLLDKPITLLTSADQKEIFLQSLYDLRVLFHGKLFDESDYFPTLTDEGVFLLHDQLGWSFDSIEGHRRILERMSDTATSTSPFVNKLIQARKILKEQGGLQPAKRTISEEIICLNHIVSNPILIPKIKQRVTLLPTVHSPSISYSKDMDSQRRDAFYQIVDWLKQGVSPEDIHIHQVSLEDMVDLSMWLGDANIPFDDDREYDVQIVPFLHELFDLASQGDVEKAIDWVKETVSNGIDHPSLSTIAKMIQTMPIETWMEQPAYFDFRLKQLSFRKEALYGAVHLHASLNITSLQAHHIILNYTEEALTKVPLNGQLSNEELFQLGIPSPIDLMRQKKEMSISLLAQMPHVRALALTQGISGHPKVFEDHLTHGIESEIPIDLSYAPRMEAKYKHLDGTKEIPVFSEISQKTVALLTDGKLRISASKLESYYECPFRFLLEDILNIKEDEPTFAQFFGNYMHDVLDHLPTVDAKLLEDILNQHQHEFPSSELVKWDIYKPNILLATHNVLSSITAIQQESKYEQSVSEGFFEMYLTDIENVQLVGRIDALYKRVYDDKTAFVVVDYKTGKEGFRSADFRSLRQLQLLIYIYLVKHQPTMTNWEALGGFYQKAYYPFIDDEETLQSHFQLDGFAVKDPLRMNDFAVQESLKGISTNKDGSYKKSTRLFDRNELDKLIEDLERLLYQTSNHIRQGHFWMRSQKENTQPLIPGGCEFCPFEHVCANKYHSQEMGGDDDGVHETSSTSD